MNKDEMIIWAKKYTKEGNKLIQRQFKCCNKHNLPFSFRNIKKHFGEWSNFYELF